MNCREIQDLLTSHLLDELTPEQNAAVREHLQSCPACQTASQDLQATLQLLRTGLADTAGLPTRLSDAHAGSVSKALRRQRSWISRVIFQRHIGTHLMRWAAIFLGIMLLAGLLMPNLSQVREKAQRENDLSHLNTLFKQVSAWGLNPSDSFRPAFPRSLEQLAKEGEISSEALTSPISKQPIEYFSGTDKDTDQPILVSQGKGGRNIVKVGGNGMWVEDGTPEAAKLDQQLASLRQKAGRPSDRSGEISGDTPPPPKENELAGPAQREQLQQRLDEYAAIAEGGARGSVKPASSLDALAASEPRRRAGAGQTSPSATPGSAGADSDSAQVKREDYAAAVPQAPARKPPEKPETKEVKVAASHTPVQRITMPAPSTFARTEIPPAQPAIKVAKMKLQTDMSRKIEQARVQRLVNVRDFQKSWGVKGYKQALEQPEKSDEYSPPPATDAPENMPAAPAEPADTNAPAPAPVVRAGGVNPFVAAAIQPFSTFSIDVDTASYTFARVHLLAGQLPPPESVRTEEFVNYFEYDYAPPNGATFAVHTDCGPSRFGRGLSLLKIGVKGRRLGREEKKKAVLTLLIDTSGSMATPDRMGLLQDALTKMVERLDPADKIAIVQYDSQPRLLLEHTPVSEKRKILDTIQTLQTSGSTALAAGMRLAYAAAARGFNRAAANRVLLLSDGMANLGTTSAEEILKSVADYRRQGISLSVFGFGSGSYNDAMLETLADKGDGVYAFIDSPAEAQRVMADELSAAINMIARDVKIQVEFNPQRVKKYRQLGYENRQLKKEQFRDDSVDAGEIGSGQAVTALYELELQGDPRAPLGMVRVRCRNALTGLIEEIEQPIMPPDSAASFAGMDARFRLAAAAAHFAEILRGSPFAAGSQFQDVARILRPVALELNLDQRIQELLRLTETGLTPRFE